MSAAIRGQRSFTSELHVVGAQTHNVLVLPLVDFIMILESDLKQSERR